MRRLLLWIAALMLIVSPALCEEEQLAPAYPVPQYVQWLLEVAQGELGYTEGRDQYTKYGEWAGNPYAEWCAEFLCWCVDQVDQQHGTHLLTTAYPRYSGMNTGMTSSKYVNYFLTNVLFSRLEQERGKGSAMSVASRIRFYCGIFEVTQTVIVAIFSKEFALKAGIYYIRVTNTDYYTIRTKFTAVNDQGNLKKKKGTTLKKKATKTALFGAGETYAKTEWFKFTLKKPQKVTLTINTYGDASFRVTFSGPKPFKKGDTNYISPGYTRTVKYWVQRGRKKLKLSKGTYYIKVQRSSNDESGYCSISWK